MLKAFLQQWLLMNMGSDLLRCRKTVVAYQKWQIISGREWGPRKQKLKLICCNINYPNTLWLLANSHLWLTCVKYAHNSLWSLHFTIARTLLSILKIILMCISHYPFLWVGSFVVQPISLYLSYCCFSDFIMMDQNIEQICYCVTQCMDIYTHTHTWYSKCIQEPLLVMEILSENKDNNEEHMQGDLLLFMQQKFFNQNGSCCMNWRTVKL